MAWIERRRMKIDTHQHFWRYRAEDFPWIHAGMAALRRDCLPSDSAQSLQASGVEAVIAVQARGQSAETDFLLQLADANPAVVGVVGWGDLRSPGLAAQLDAWSEHPAFKGLRHILQDEPDVPGWLGDAAVNRGLATLQQRQGVYDVLVFEHQLPEVIGFCGRHDGHWLVLDHLGKPSLRDMRAGDVPLPGWRQALRAMGTMPHVACKLSGLVTETDWRDRSGLSAEAIAAIHACFDEALAAFGPQRLMFGSDWPVCQLAASGEAVHRIADEWSASRLSADEQEAFWSGNAVRIYGLALPAAPHFRSS
jgi:L-fuconolactonase